MKGILSFTLPEENEEFQQAQRAGKAEAVIDELYRMLRHKQKYEDKETLSIDEIRQYLNDSCNDFGLER